MVFLHFGVCLGQVNLTGGYYDAGDNVKFGWPMAFTVSLLSWAAIEYEKEISSVDQLGHLHTAILWGTNFILRAHTSPTTLYTQVLNFLSSIYIYILNLLHRKLLRLSSKFSA
jgi:hypothetical protein